MFDTLMSLQNFEPLSCTSSKKESFNCRIWSSPDILVENKQPLAFHIFQYSKPDAAARDIIMVSTLAQFFIFHNFQSASRVEVKNQKATKESNICRSRKREKIIIKTYISTPTNEWRTEKRLKYLARQVFSFGEIDKNVHYLVYLRHLRSTDFTNCLT